jgi:hypothetical protein
MRLFAFLKAGYSSHDYYSIAYSPELRPLPFEHAHLDIQPSFYKKIAKNDWTDLLSEKSFSLLPGFDNSVGCSFGEKFVLVFSRRGMTELYDLLNYPGNIIQTLFLNDEPAFFHVYPVAPDCGEPYPTYASLSAYAEEHNLHYFRKFADSNYVIVTETLRQRFRQAKLKGASFLLKFDGKRSWPAI